MHVDVCRCSANDRSDTYTQVRSKGKDGPRTNRCRVTPCADWLVGLTRRMEEDKHAIVRALHEDTMRPGCEYCYFLY